MLNSIKIDVKPQFLPEQSDENEPRFVFSYTITITNQYSQPVKLLSRQWLITDANGKTTTVQGEGVIGQQPEIAPAASFTYTSGAILKTPLGTMQGSYDFITESKHFMVSIPVFTLSVPHLIH